MFRFIEQHSFATLVIFDGIKPVASHVPVLRRQIDGVNMLTGHLAFANEQWQSFSKNQQALIIFQGPHAYVSSSWYDHENVSTWNYQAVHMYGTLSQATKEETIEDVFYLQDHYEQGRPQAVTVDKLSDKTKEQVKGIVGFRMTIESVEASYKMSQNRNEGDYEQIIHQLKEEKADGTYAVASIMENLKK